MVVKLFFYSGQGVVVRIGGGGGGVIRYRLGGWEACMHIFTYMENSNTHPEKVGKGRPEDFTGVK